MVLLTFLTLRTFRKKSGLGKGDGGWGAYETMKTKNQSTLNCTVLARLTHAPIKKTNTKRVRKRANQSCGSLSPKMSHNKQDRSHSHVAGYQTRWPICPSYQRNCFSYHLEKKKKCTRPFRESVKTAMQASLQLPTEQLPTKHHRGAETVVGLLSPRSP